MINDTWRDHLTPEEREVIDRADQAKEQWQLLNASRAGIVNRALRRAKYRSEKVAPSPTDGLIE